MAFLKKLVGKKSDPNAKYADDELSSGNVVLEVQAARPDDKIGHDVPQNNPEWNQTVHTKANIQDNQQQKSQKSKKKKNELQENHQDLPFGPNTQKLAPGIYVPKQPKKKKRKFKTKKKLEGILRKTSKGLTPPSYFCSGFTALCGFICFVSGLCMLIMGTVIDTYKVTTSSGNFMRVGGGIFVIIGFVMMLSGLFYFLLVYMRHRGMFNKKDEEKPPPPEVVESDEDSDSESDADEKNNVKESNLGGQSISSDQGINFTARQHSYDSTDNRRNSSVNANSVVMPPNPRLSQRRQSVAIGQGIALGHIGESSTDTMGSPERPLVKNQSDSELKYQPSFSPRTQKESTSFYPLSTKLPPISTTRRGSVAVDTRTFVTKLDSLDELVADAPAGGSRLTTRRASLFQATNPNSPGSVTTPKILKKTKSALDLDLTNTPRTPLSARRPSEAKGPLFERRDSFSNMYVRNK